MSTPADTPGEARPGQVAPAREAAFAALRRLRRSGKRLDESAAALPEISSLSPADRGLANELVNGTVKRRASIDAVLGAYTKAPLKDAQPDVRDALRLTAFQLLFLDRVPAYAAVDDGVTLASRRNRKARGFANAVLRKVAAEGRAKLEELGAGDGTHAWSARLSYPGWLVKLLRAELGDARAAQVLEAANSAPERCLRANGMRGGVEAAIQALSAEGFKTRGVKGLPEALLYDGPPLERSTAFTSGLVTPQSRGSQVAGLVAAGGVSGPAARVLDVCAAPGAKTSQLAALLPSGHVTAVEVDEARAADLQANLTRLGADAVEVVRADALELPGSWDGTFDAVLLDAPCTGLGTLGIARGPALAEARAGRAAPREAPGAAARARRRPGQARRRAHLRRLHGHARRDARRGRAAPRRGRLGRRRPRRGLAGPGAPGGRRLPAHAAARGGLHRVLRRPPPPPGGIEYRRGARPRRRRTGGAVEDILRGINVAPSILSADFSRLGEDVETVINAGARVIHFDVMDGRFVPNITIGPLVARAIAPVVHGAGALLDVHLMIEQPENYVVDFVEAGADVVVVHQEACTHLNRVLSQIREAGALAGVALNPSTPVETLVGGQVLLRPRGHHVGQPGVRRAELHPDLHWTRSPAPARSCRRTSSSRSTAA